MRILHTSDWHLGARLRHVARQPHICDRLVEIAGYLDQHRVDVMVVAGDLFDRRHLPTDDLRSVLTDVRQAFERFLLNQGTIVAISGNHDHEGLFTLLQTTLDLAAPVDRRDAGPRRPGRLYLAPGPGLLRLCDRAGQQVQFALLPYPTVSRYLEGAAASVTSPEERHERLRRGLVGRLEQMCQRLDPRLPSVLLAHTHVRGAQLHNLYDLDLKDDVVFETAHLPALFAYAAYGHIHRAQALADSTRVRYSGSPERMDRAEREDDKSVVLVDITRSGASEPALLPLRATPMTCVTVREPGADLAALAERCPDPQTIVYYTLELPPEARRDAVHDEVRRRYPNAVRESGPAESLQSPPPDEARGASASALSARLRDLRGTVVSYLGDQLAGYGNKGAALKVVNDLIDELEAEPMTEPLSEEA